MEQALLIVWRESVEALLVIGLLYARLSRQPERRRHLRLLWAGVAGGAALAALLATLMVVAGSWMSGPTGEWFQAAMSALASLLVLQMVVWMARNAPPAAPRFGKPRRTAAMSQGRHAALALLAALAVAREGSEITLFLYGASGPPAPHRCLAVPSSVDCSVRPASPCCRSAAACSTGDASSSSARPCCSCSAAPC